MLKKKFANTSRFITASPKETKALAGRLARKLKVGDVVLFVANLGAGKTTFIQGLTAALGGAEEASSPTFILAQTYEAKFPIHHLDFYRLTPKEILAMGIEDYFTGRGEIPKGLLLIEWANRFPSIWPKERLEIHINIKNNSKREFTFVTEGNRYLTLLKSLQNHRKTGASS